MKKYLHISSRLIHICAIKKILTMTHLHLIKSIRPHSGPIGLRTSFRSFRPFSQRSMKERRSVF